MIRLWELFELWADLRLDDRITVIINEDTILRSMKVSMILENPELYNSEVVTFSKLKSFIYVECDATKAMLFEAEREK